MKIRPTFTRALLVLTVFGVGLLATPGALAQPGNSPTGTSMVAAREAEAILRKGRQLDLLNEILPVLMTKEQLKKILPSVEKARLAVRKVEAEELITLRVLEKQFDTMMKAAIEKGQVPSQEEMQSIALKYREMNFRRLEVSSENAEMVEKALRANLNAGQLKAAQNALSPARFDPALDPTKMTDEQKLRFWVRMVLLDPLSYDLLVKLSM